MAQLLGAGLHEVDMRGAGRFIGPSRVFVRADVGFIPPPAHYAYANWFKAGPKPRGAGAVVAVTVASGHRGFATPPAPSSSGGGAKSMSVTGWVGERRETMQEQEPVAAAAAATTSETQSSGVSPSSSW